jgi:hypothetical protein
VPAGTEHAGQLGERGVEVHGRRVDDRVPAGDPAQRSVLEREVVQLALLERDPRMGGTGGGDHRRRHVEPHDVDAALGEERGDPPGPAPDVGDACAGLGGHRLGERRQERPVRRRLGRRADLGPDEREVPLG